ncbi:nuclear body protein SP140-like protein isoform X2 [Onychostoma macrolepis]|uniref:nuclear body protein SP140-like protein isoform X2 n=1 Tax=Onychostoma macrolepis TaxID=369639 RepID=UPI00272CB5E5|nr:nuclear body protein SP140-like protein isoform X2 [Onychostoma macrolepis]
MDTARRNIKNNNTTTMEFGFFTHEELCDHFCQNKTKMSTIEEPLMFLRHLKDNRLITDELYQKLENTGDDNGVYCALDYIEKRGKKDIRKFWQCVDQEHILQRYSQLSEITTALMNFHESQGNRKRERAEDRGTGKEREIKKRRTESNCESDQAGPSSQSTNSQRTTDKHEKRELQSPPDSSTQESFSCPYLHRKAEDLWNMPKHKRWLPVTCGNEKASLDREALNNRKRNCIKYGREMISPFIFEKMGGKETCKSWKTSILCQDTSLKRLMEMKMLKIPELNRKFTLRK